MLGGRWTEVCNIVPEAANKTTPKKKKSKGDREGCIQLNSDFQRVSRRDKKAFFNVQCLKIEENNKRAKTSNLFRKTGNIMGVFYPKMDTVRDKNDRDLVDGEEIKKRWKEYMEELYKKDLK